PGTDVLFGVHDGPKALPPARPRSASAEHAPCPHAYSWTLAAISQLIGMAGPAAPFASFGTESECTLAKFRGTFSGRPTSPPEPPVETEATTTSSILILMYSTGDPPALRTVRRASS